MPTADLPGTPARQQPSPGPAPAPAPATEDRPAEPDVTTTTSTTTTTPASAKPARARKTSSGSASASKLSKPRAAQTATGPTPSKSRVALAAASPTAGTGVLKGVVAHVHVNTEDNADASKQFVAELESMGAKIRKTLCAECTHLIIQNPLSAVLAKYASLSAKGATALEKDKENGTPAKKSRTAAKDTPIIAVNVLWVEECKRHNKRIDEKEFLVDLTAMRAKIRSKKRKSMEPMKPNDVDVTDDRFSSSQQQQQQQQAAVASEEAVASPAKKAKSPKAEKARTTPSAKAAGPSASDNPTTPSTSKAATPALSKPKASAPSLSKSKAKATPVLSKAKAASAKDGKSSKKSEPSVGAEDDDSRAGDSEVARESGPTPKRSPKDSTPKSKTPPAKPSRTLVMTNIDDTTRDIVVSTLRKLGGFKLASRVQESTTHVICGDSRRTMSICKAVARGCWLLSPEWVYRSLESEKWIPEGEFEMVKEFPACQQARNLCSAPPAAAAAAATAAQSNEHDNDKGDGAQAPALQKSPRTSAGLGLLNGVKVFVGRTDGARDEVQELVAYLGGVCVSAFSLADVGIGHGIFKRKSVERTVVSEKWLYDSVTKCKGLPYAAYVAKSADSLAESDDGDEGETDDAAATDGDADEAPSSPTF